MLDHKLSPSALETTRRKKETHHALLHVSSLLSPCGPRRSKVPKSLVSGGGKSRTLLHQVETTKYDQGSKSVELQVIRFWWLSRSSRYRISFWVSVFVFLWKQIACSNPITTRGLFVTFTKFEIV